MRNPYANYPTVTHPTPSPVLTAALTFKVFLAPINDPSDDHRVIVGDLGWREPPLPFLASDSEMGHGDAIHVGNLSDFTLENVDGVDWVTGSLVYDTDEAAAEFQRLASEGKFNGVSIHMGKVDFWPVHLVDGIWVKLTEEDLDELFDPIEIEIVAGESEPVDPWSLIFDGAFDAEIAAATQVAIPAFPGSKIEVVGELEEPIAASTMFFTTMTGEQLASASMASANVLDWQWYQMPAASGGNISITPATVGADAFTAQILHDMNKPLPPYDSGDTIQAAVLDRPPRSWFNDPLFGETDDDPRLVWSEKWNQYACPLTVTEDGQIFGHLAMWNQCLNGVAGSCLKPPRDADPTRFLTSTVIADNGDRVAVGPLVVDDGHVPPSWAPSKVQQYYADTRLAGGYVNVGQDDHGWWVAGAASHKASPAQIETMRRHPLSGQWNPSKGGYELMAAVCVNSPGFEIPRAIAAASGEVEALVTSGPYDETASDMELVTAAIAVVGRELHALRAELAELRDRPEVEAEAAELEALLNP